MCLITLGLGLGRHVPAATLPATFSRKACTAPDSSLPVFTHVHAGAGGCFPREGNTDAPSPGTAATVVLVGDPLLAGLSAGVAPTTALPPAAALEDSLVLSAAAVVADVDVVGGGDDNVDDGGGGTVAWTARRKASWPWRLSRCRNSTQAGTVTRREVTFSDVSTPEMGPAWGREMTRNTSNYEKIRSTFQGEKYKGPSDAM